MVREGHRAVMFFCVSRADVTSFAPADDIDPTYGQVLREVVAAGVEVLAYATLVTPERFELGRRLRVHL
jgi:sugar fermentation stimulation protein A